MGDFNSILAGHVTAGRNADMKSLDTLSGCFSEQLLVEPTRGEAITALVLSGAQDLVQEVIVAELLGISDQLNIPVVGKTPQQPNTVG